MENVAPIIAPNKEQMLQHLDMLFGRALSGRVEITCLHTDKSAPRRGIQTQFFDVDDLDAAADFAVRANAEPGWNAYVGAALRSEDVFPGKAADDDDFLKTYVVWADADDGDQLAAARETYRALGITPPLAVVTGRTPSKRAQLWWPLDNPIDNIDTLRATLRGIAAILKTDPKVCTGKQLMRLAGGVNWPKKEDRILERTETVTVAKAAREFSLEQIQRAFPPVSRVELSSAVPDVEVKHGGALGLEERVMDGRETYAFNLVTAHLHEFIGTTGSEPSVDELYRSVAPVFLAKVDQVRAGRGPEFLKQKCADRLRAYHSGQIPFMRGLEEAVLSWADRASTQAARGYPNGYPDEVEGDGDGELVRVGDIYEVLSLADLRNLPDPNWLVEDMIPECGLGFVYGAPGSFKSFICLDLALALAYGHATWSDKPVKRKGSVLYLAAEGSAGFKNRVRAWQIKHGVENDADAFHLIRVPMSFMEKGDVEKLERTVAAIISRTGPIDTIFVDTVSRVLPGADENLQKDMTVFVAACDRLRSFGCAVIGVHHTNKAGEMRGSTVFRGQGDFIFKVERDEEAQTGAFVCEKQKEAEDGWRIAFSMQTHAWLQQGRLKEVSSLTVTMGGEPAPTKSAGGWPEISVCKAALSAVQEAWNRGAPWSPHARSRTEGRFAIENISRALGLEMKTAEMMVFEWQRNDVLRFEVHDPKTKSKGLRVAQWPDWSGGNVGGNTSPGRKHDA